MLLVTLLCTVFVLPLGLGNENRISQNFKNLFDAAAARNDTIKRHELKALHESQREQEETFNAFHNEVKMMKEDRRIKYGDYRNDTTRRKKESEVFNEQRFRDNLETDLEKYDDKERIKRLTDKLVGAEKEIVRVGGIVTKIEERKFTDAQYKIILAIRSRIEDVIDELFPDKLRQPTSYKEKVKIILKSGSPDSFPLLQEVISMYSPYPEDRCIELFAEALEVMFGKASGVGAHQVVDSETLETLRTCDEKELCKYLSLLKVQPDEKYVKALRIISKPLPTSNQGYIGTLVDHCCIRMTPKNQQKMFNHNKYNIQEGDVKEFFPTINAELVKWIKFNHDTEKNILSIEVRFGNTNAAVTAYNENHGWLKRVRIGTEIISCTDPTETITSGAPGAS